MSVTSDDLDGAEQELQKLYEDLEQTQKNLDAWIHYGEMARKQLKKKRIQLEQLSQTPAVTTELFYLGLFVVLSFYED